MSVWFVSEALWLREDKTVVFAAGAKGSSWAAPPYTRTHTHTNATVYTQQNTHSSWDGTQ